MLGVIYRGSESQLLLFNRGGGIYYLNLNYSESNVIFTIIIN